MSLEDVRLPVQFNIFSFRFHINFRSFEWHWTSKDGERKNTQAIKQANVPESHGAANGIATKDPQSKQNTD